MIMYRDSDAWLRSMLGYDTLWEFYCDKCGNHWRKELPMVNYPRVKCDDCGDIDQLNLAIR